jgi:predicted DNA-binding protein (UPF0251 family)/predicted Fe-Mo cluster-binding NifX family protein
MVHARPGITYFKPRGIPLRHLTELYLPLDGYEALRLVDVEGLKQEEAAARMNVSRQTFGRILASARRVVAEALVQGMALRIEGSDDVAVAAGEELERATATASGSGRRIAKDTPKPNAEEQKMTKVAISCEGPSLDDAVDPRFGRAAGFLIVDPETLETEYVDNGASQVMAQGAGIQAAEIVAAAGVGVVLTGYVGPKAFMALSAAGIKVGQDLENMTAREALERYRQGRVAVAEQPNRQGHGR